jgi:hypothetical protein
LKLLEQHHQKLAEILKHKPDEAQAFVSTSSSVGVTTSQNSPSSPTQSTAKGAEPRTLTHHPPQSPTHRDLTSSIASNLASARGIPAPRVRRGQQSLAQVSPQVAEGRVLKPARRSNLGEHEMRASLLDEKTEALKGQPVSPSRQRNVQTDREHGPSRRNSTVPASATPAISDDPFSRFYSTFGNIISTLSAPLAFAGLPLASDTPVSPETAQTKPSSPTASRIAPDPDLARYFSRAALRAVREEHGGLGGGESFYVVPTSGGTISYAGMLSHARQSSNLTEEDEAEFVDANEMPQPPSPGLSRQREPRSGSKSRLSTGRTNKTWEEMAVENETLKAVVLDLGDRLRAFELGAQRSSRALHASVRGLSSPTGSITTASGVPPLPGAEGFKVLQEKLRESEEEMKNLRKENKRLLRENQKFMSVIERYRERWEMLKVGARERVKGDPPRSKSQEDDERAQTPV